MPNFIDLKDLNKDQLIDLISETDTPIPVTSVNGEKLVGEIDRTIVMKAMSSKS